MDILKAIKDPQFKEDVLRGLGETFSRGVAGVAGAPVDIATMAMRPFGYDVPAEQVVGGSEYIGRQMERAGLLSSARNPTAEFLAGMVTPDPMDMAKLGAMAVPVVGKAVKGLEGIKNEASQKSFIDFMSENVSDVLPAHVKAGVLPRTQVHDIVDIDKLTPSEYDAFGEILSSPSSMKKIQELRKAENLPPVLIKGTQEDKKYLPQVIDGHHRTMASILNLKQKIPVSYDAETLAEIWKQQNKSSTSVKDLIKNFEESLQKQPPMGME